jgi:hypothetical protein
VGLVTEEGVEPSRIFIHTIELKQLDFSIISHIIICFNQRVSNLLVVIIILYYTYMFFGEHINQVLP